MKRDKRIKGEDETLDTFYHGRILVLQKKKGFRFSVDAPLLADFIQPQETDRLLEIGTGCGVISLLLSIKPFLSITALEIQDSLADLARRNVRLNDLEARIRVVQKDVLDFSSGEKFDIVFANPPYIKQRSGHLSPSDEKSVAKHELKCTLFDIMQRTGELLKNEGKAYFIYPAKRRMEFMQAVKENALRICALRQVFPYEQGESNLFLACLDFHTDKERQLAPLILFDSKGKYSEEAQQIFAGRSYATTV
ncbi:MAG: methyltransferase [Candidatus Aminicenantes bacterium]|nr:methyltransferase [Candidatus Aminicenantes bacterium]